MKRKLLALVTLMLCAVTGAWAQDVYKIQFNGANKEIKNGVEQSELSFFSYNSAKHSFNTKFNGCTYDGVTYTSGLKMESATNVSWTSTAKSNVIIVQSTWSANTIKFDGTELAVNDASTSVEGCRIYTISDVEKGEHSVTRGSGESGIFAITVEYTETALPQLDAPTISDLSETGNKVTISYPTNASSVVYTLDGSDPSADNGTAISATTDVTITTDGTTVKAIAIGDGTTYANSQIASKVIYLPGIEVATPVVEDINGTMAITCETANATILYSLDGTTFQEYTKPVTFFEDTNVTVKATRSACIDSDEAVVVVEGAPAATEGSKTKVLSFMFPEENEGWEWMEADNKRYGIKGVAGSDEDGWSLWISPNGNVYDKELSSGGSYSIGGTAYKYIKGSNGRQFNIDLPEGVTANRITIYSFNNSAITGPSLWSLVAGETYTADNEIPLQATAAADPDIRVFPLEDVTETISLNNNGIAQQCFIAVIDYTDGTEEGIPGPKDPEYLIKVATISLATCTSSNSNKLWTNNSNSDYTLTSADGDVQMGKKTYGDVDRIKLTYDKTYKVTVPSNVKVEKIVVTGASASSNGTPIKVGTTSYTFASTEQSYTYNIANATAGTAIEFSVENKEFGLTSIELYANAGQTLTTTANMEGWRAFYDEYYNYTLDANTKAYVATEVKLDETEPTVVLEPISAVPAGMAVLLKTTNKLGDGTYSMELTEAESVPTPNVTKNMLKAAKDADNPEVYRLGYNSNAGVAFFPYTIDTTTKSDVVVLELNVSNQARQLTIRISDGSETTAIKSVDVNVSANKTVYDLQGRRVTQPSKGLYIVNGKKVIIK